MAAAGNRNILCKDVATQSAIALAALCQLERLLGDDEEYDGCIADVVNDYIDAFIKCNSDYANDIEFAMNELVLDLDIYIEAYSGCDDLDNLVLNWQEYWDTL